MSRHSPFVIECANELKRTQRAHELVDKLCDMYENQNTLATVISNIRYHCLEHLDPVDHEELDALLERLEESKPELKQQLKEATPRELLKLQKILGEKDEDIRTTPLFHSWFSEFKLPAHIYQQRREACAKARAQRSITLHDIRGLFAWLESITVESNVYHRILACAIMTGRRSIELLFTGRFEPIEDNPYSCMFHGQVKKRGITEDCAYRIPLLFPFGHVIALIDSFRNDLEIDLEEENTDERRVQIHQRFASTIRNNLGRTVAPFFSGELKVHDLRSVYAKLTYDYLFDEGKCDLTYPGWVQAILGHSSETISIHYNRVRESTATRSYLCDYFKDASKFSP